MQKKQPIIITGLHRSGTSFLTRIMENNSVFFGESKDINQESLFFQNINSKLVNRSELFSALGMIFVNI